MSGFTCSGCGAHHATPPLAYHAGAPAYWSPNLADDPGSELGTDQCVIGGEHFFVRGLVELPVIGSDDVFAWGVWVSLSKESFVHASTRWHDEDRANDAPYFGWLSTDLAGYAPSTLDLKTNLHTRPVGTRPFVELEPTDHPLAVEQCTGITRHRVQRIAERALHPG
ncbi:DUF2199 domain-containing protein [Actinophytocola sp.]|uniref:DUF2199 domain-containing protein n=1 Tax=Actinophytocola sp. TaxID=1872138 RepID=UPI002ED8532B